MTKVTVTTPSRVHFALVDLNGGLGRIDAGIGLSLSHPGFKISAQRSDRVEITGAEWAIRRAEEVLKLLGDSCPAGNTRIDIQESVPPHSGLGSGTQLSLGIATAVCRLHGLSLSPREIALAVGRGGTSGIGVAAFDQGGFILDGGHSFSNDEMGTPKPEKTSFLPSSASRGVSPPPVLIRYDFPDWDVLITIPNCKHISGKEEVNLFQSRCPLPLSEVQTLSHIILMKLLPALVLTDIRAFGEAIDQIQGVAWKKVEVQEQDPVVRETMSFLRQNGGHGVGLSSWGPAIFCFGEGLEALEKKTQEFLMHTESGGICFLTRANNTGATITEEENGLYASRSAATDLQGALRP